jgi:hypothetical protein
VNHHARDRSTLRWLGRMPGRLPRPRLPPRSADLAADPAGTGGRDPPPPADRTRQVAGADPGPDPGRRAGRDAHVVPVRRPAGVGPFEADDRHRRLCGRARSTCDSLRPPGGSADHPIRGLTNRVGCCPAHGEPGTATRGNARAHAHTPMGLCDGAQAIIVANPLSCRLRIGGEATARQRSGRSGRMPSRQR